MPAIDAAPFAFPLDPAHAALIVIDMQRDFIEPGGFGASLGNDVSRLAAIVPTVRRLLDGCRAAGIAIIHTMECHRPDLSDCPPAKRNRGSPLLRIGDRGAMGRLLVAGEPGTAIVPERAPRAGEQGIEKPGTGATSCWSRTRPRALSPSSRPPRWRWCGPRVPSSAGPRRPPLCWRRSPEAQVVSPPCCASSSRFSTLPDGLVGRLSRNTILLGRL